MVLKMKTFCHKPERLIKQLIIKQLCGSRGGVGKLGRWAGKKGEGGNEWKEGIMLEKGD